MFSAHLLCVHPWLFVNVKSVFFNLYSIFHIAEFLYVCVKGLRVYLCVFTASQMGVICHNGLSIWLMEWEHKRVERREPGPASTKTCGAGAGTGSELTRGMIEKAQEVKWALWTSIIESKHWEEHEKIGWKRGRMVRSDRWYDMQRGGQGCSAV